MKRSKALTTLSREHHQALFVAKVIKDSKTQQEATDAFVEFWNRHGSLHFRIEEEVLLPGSGLPGPSVDDDVARLLDEHLEIRRGAARVTKGEMSLDEIKDLGSLLKQHVRFEERELFPRIETELGPDQLEILAVEIEAAEIEIARGETAGP